MVEVYGKKATRYGFGEGLVQLGQNNPRVFALGADTAASVTVNLFQEKFPDRFANVGIAEQNMIGIAAGLAVAGWIPYARQIGQTGKIVKPSLYVALGVSGAIQHKVGMQAAEAIVAVNRDPDAPLAEFADLYVVGDLFEVVPAVLAQLRGRGS
jgi:hypothetical protein